MDMMERTYRVLIVTASHKFVDAVMPILEESRFSPVQSADSSACARRMLLESEFDIVIINAPLNDELGTRLALDICDHYSSGVLLLVKSELYPDVNGKVSPYGVLTVSKPANPTLVSQSLTLLCATRERLRRAEQKAASLEEKMTEIRLVNKAKWLLIDRLKMTEADAHHYVEKTAMNRCVTKRSVAESIIKMYS